MKKSRTYTQTVNCELCGKSTPKISRTQRRCKICVPTKAAYQRACRYGISESEFEALRIKQGNACALCSNQLHHDHINGLHVDHDHITKRVRGLLCGTCNVGIGFLERLLSKSNLKAVLAYLETPT